jgi:osmotically-inducible protein OsmY
MTNSSDDQGSLERTPDGGMSLDEGRVQFEPREGEAPGPYAGRGPRGMLPSDSQIGAQVCALMTEHDWIDASDIEVEVADSEVTLRGGVEDTAARRLAENIALAVSTVRAVHNQLQVRAGEREQA